MVSPNGPVSAFSPSPNRDRSGLGSSTSADRASLSETMPLSISGLNSRSSIGPVSPATQIAIPKRPGGKAQRSELPSPPAPLLPPNGTSSQSRNRALAPLTIPVPNSDTRATVSPIVPTPRQSSLAQPRPEGAPPRTPLRVRFDLEAGGPDAVSTPGQDEERPRREGPLSSVGPGGGREAAGAPGPGPKGRRTGVRRKDSGTRRALGWFGWLGGDRGGEREYYSVPMQHLLPRSASSSSSSSSSAQRPRLGGRRREQKRNHGDGHEAGNGPGSGTGARAPLLASMAAPTVRVAEMMDRQDASLYAAGAEIVSDSDGDFDFDPGSDPDGGRCAPELDNDDASDSDPADVDETTRLADPASAQALRDLEAMAEHATRPRSGLWSAFMNMANSIVGAGIIGQPYALRQAGLVAGVVLMVVLTVAVDWTIRLVVVNSKLAGAPSFHGTVERCYGRWGRVGIAFAQWAFAFGGMVAFGVIIGDSIPPVITAVFPAVRTSPALSVLADRRVVTAVAVGTVSYPLSLYRDISKLAKASAFALVSMCVIVGTVVTQAVQVPAHARGSVSGLWAVNPAGLVQAVGVISFAFVCHHNSLLIYGSLEKPTLDRFATVTHYSTGISLVASLAVALAGFATFGDRTAGNVLNNFPGSGVVVTVARLCFGLNMLTTFPLEAFVCRDVVESVFFADGKSVRPAARLGGRGADRVARRSGSETDSDRTRHVLVTTAHVVAAAAIALTTCDLGVVLEVVGATSACALAYVLPPLCFLRLTPAAAAAAAGAGAGASFGAGASAGAHARPGLLRVSGRRNRSRRRDGAGAEMGLRRDGDTDPPGGAKERGRSIRGSDSASPPLSPSPHSPDSDTDSVADADTDSHSNSDSDAEFDLELDGAGLVSTSRADRYVSTTTGLHVLGKRVSLAAPRVGAVAVAGFGVLVGVLSVAMTVRTIVSGAGGEKAGACAA